MALQHRFSSNMIASLLIAALAGSSAECAELVTWSDVPKKIGHGKLRSDGHEDRDYRIATKSGTTYVGHQLIFRPTGVSLGPPGPFIPREQITEVRIHRDRQLSDALVAPGGAVLNPICSGGGYCFPGWPIVFLVPLAIGVTVVVSPFVLPIEGVKRLLPDRVVKVQP